MLVFLRAARVGQSLDVRTRAIKTYAPQTSRRAIEKDAASVRFRCGSRWWRRAAAAAWQLYEHNLWEPRDAEDDHGAHGIFDARAHHADRQQWCSRHPGLATAALAATGLAAAARWRRRSST